MVAVARWLLALFSLVVPLTLALPAAHAESIVPNNKVGINVIRWFDAHYLSAVSQIVNSSGGDWGYVTVLLVDDDLQNPARVQSLLDDAHRYHLIPIFRLATHQNSMWWVKPAPDQAAQWKKLFLGLKWHTPAAYLVVGNEPNLGIEWGGQPNPQEYARYLASFLDTFADVRDRFKILNGPMDLSNLTQPGMMDEFEFLAGMKAEVPDIFTRLDGWATNPYHFFEDRGIRFTYRGYSLELDYIGVNLPVFITESYIGFVDDPQAIGQYYETAFNYWMKDPRVVAATPHFYNPEARLFWMFDADASGNPIGLSPTAVRLRQLPKMAGTPNFVTSLSSMTASPGALAAMALVGSRQDYAIPNGHFYTQTNGSPLGKSPYGYSITDDSGVPLWSEFQRLGGVDLLGYPVSRRFFMDGFIAQATQKFILQWRPGENQAWFVNVFDLLAEKGRDDWLLSVRQTPRHPGSAGDSGLTWNEVMKRHWSILDGDPTIKAAFQADKDPLSHYGLPISLADMGNAVVLRAQRAVFQRWKEDVPWAGAGDVTVANGGDIAKEIGLLPIEAVVLESPPAALSTAP